MTRVELLAEVLKEAGIRYPQTWLREERAAGEAGAVLEICTLLCAIKKDLTATEDSDWLDRTARHCKGADDGFPFEKAIASLAASNLDRTALMEVIRYWQRKMAWLFLVTLHDGAGHASEAAKHLRFHITYDDTSAYTPGDTDRKLERMRLLPNSLLSYWTSFLEQLDEEREAKLEGR